MPRTRAEGEDFPESGISMAELQVLKMLWKRGPSTVREIHGHLARAGARWAYTTVLTLLQRLQAKGYVTNSKDGMAYVFRPTLTREGVLRGRLRELAQHFAEGAAFPLVQAMVEGHRFSEEEIAHFRKLVEELESGKSRGKRQGRG